MATIEKGLKHINFKSEQNIQLVTRPNGIMFSIVANVGRCRCCILVPTTRQRDWNERDKQRMRECDKITRQRNKMNI